MSSSKIVNSSRNTFYGFLLKAFQLIAPFVIRTIIIKVLGLQYAGLNSLFVSILSVLNIAELGIGFTIVFSMYKPIAENDQVKICALMKVYKLYYRIIGSVVLCLGVALVPFLPRLIAGEVPNDINLYYLYFLNLGATVLSYWLFAYKNCLFAAHQRNDIISKLTLATDFIKYCAQAILLVVFKNYYLFLFVTLISQVLNNLLSAIAATKAYPKYKPFGDLDPREKKQLNASIKDVFLGQIGFVVTTSVDTIVISAFLGLIPLAIYQNYYYILNALIAFFAIFFQSCRASIGTNLLKKTIKENYTDFKFISFVVFGALCFCVSCLISMYQPFMTIWVGEEGLLDTACVILFGIYLLTYEACLTLGCYKDSSGKWHSDRFRPFVTAVVNLSLNIIMVNWIGLYGILLSTIISYWAVNIPWLFHRVFVDVFSSKEKKDYVLFFLKGVSLVVLFSALSYIACQFVSFQNQYITLIVRFFLSSFISVAFYIVCNAKTSEIHRARTLVDAVLTKLGGNKRSKS